MSDVNYSKLHYQTYRSAVLDKPINDARDANKMVGEDTLGIYDSSINFDYVCRFLMAKYPDFIPIPGTDRRAGILYADDMGLSVELQPYMDTEYVPVIDVKDIRIGPIWEYHGNHQDDDWNAWTNPYEEVRGTTPRKEWRVGKSDSRDVTANEFMETQLNNPALPRLNVNTTESFMFYECKTYDDLFARNKDKGAWLEGGIAGSLGCMDMARSFDLYWPFIKSDCHHNYEPKAWVSDNRWYSYGILPSEQKVTSPSFVHDGVPIGNLMFNENSCCASIGAAGPVFESIWRGGWEDWRFWFHTPRYIYPCDIFNSRWRTPASRYSLSSLSGDTPWVYLPHMIGEFNATPHGNYWQYGRLTDAAVDLLRRSGNKTWSLYSVSWGRVQYEKSKWVPRTTPVITDDVLTNNKKLVLDRVVRSAELLGRADSKGRYSIEIDGQSYSLPATYTKTSDVEPPEFTLVHEMQHIDDDSHLFSTNFCPEPEETTLFKAMGAILNIAPDASAEEILEALAEYLRDYYVTDGTCDMNAHKHIRDDLLSIPQVAKCLKLSSVGNTDHYTLYGTYKDGAGLKSLKVWWKESSFTASITIIRGEVK